jgi:hypothetical protein
MSTKIMKLRKPKATSRPRRQGRAARANRASRSQPQKQGKTYVRIAPATAQWINTLGNPFGNQLSSGVPDFPATLTRKFKCFVKGTADTGTTGFGFVVAEFLNAAASDVVCVRNSLSTYAGTTVDYTTGATVSNSLSNSDYVAADFGNTPTTLQYRIVGAGLKVRYTGTELNKGGQLIAFADPRHRSVFQRSISSIDGNDTSRRFAMNREWTTVLYRHVDTDDLDFTATLPTVTPANTDSTFYTVVCFQAPAGVSLSFEWEMHAHFEVVGRNIRGATPSYADPTGFAAVNAVTIFDDTLLPSQVPHKEYVNRVLLGTARYLAGHSSSATEVDPRSASEVLEGAQHVVDTAASAVNLASGIWSFVSMFV